MPLTRRARLRAFIALVVYSLFVGFVVLWPVPVDRPFDIPLFRFLGTLDRYGIRPMDAYTALEVGSNVLFYVPAGILLVLIVGSRRWWLAPLGGLAASSMSEVTQYMFLPERFATLTDVIANTAGALLGAGIGVLIFRRIARRANAAAESLDGRTHGRRAAGRAPVGALGGGATPAE